MKVQQTFFSNSYLMDMAETNTVPKSMVEVQQSTVNVPIDAVFISEEGMKALRDGVKALNPESEDIDVSKLSIQDTNEVAWEHYTAMGKIRSSVLSDGNYNVEDVMKSMMHAYESIYNKIVEEHANGERQVSYELTGERTLTLEEDLEGLNQAYEMCLANLEGYITCQQTKKAFENPGDISWYLDRIGIQNSRKNDIQNKAMEKWECFDRDYQSAAVSMMKQAREEFLMLFNNTDYKKGAAIGIISDILNKNEDFMLKTQKLFA